MRLSWLPLASLLAMGGCIENPAPDPRIGRDTQDMDVFLDYQEEPNLLTLRMLLEGDTLRLRVKNTGRRTIDSAALIVQGRRLTDYRQPSMWTSFRRTKRPEFEWPVRIGRIAPGAAQDLGVFDTAFLSGLDEHFWSAEILRLSENGRPLGLRTGCAFKGTYRRFDLGGGREDGAVLGTLAADGRLKLGFFPDPEDEEPRSELEAMVRADSTISNGAYTRTFTTGSSLRDTAIFRYGMGIWSPDGGEFVGSIHLFESSNYPSDYFRSPRAYSADSLEFRIEPYFPG